MRAVIDTNIIISAVLRPGSSPDQVVQAGVRRHFQAITSPPLLAELKKVLSRPRVTRRLITPPEEVDRFIKDMESAVTMVDPAESLSVIADPPDNRVLEAVVAGEADYIISGDRDLLDLGKYEGIEIVTPAMFLAILATS